MEVSFQGFEERMGVKVMDVVGDNYLFKKFSDVNKEGIIEFVRVESF